MDRTNRMQEKDASNLNLKTSKNIEKNNNCVNYTINKQEKIMKKLILSVFAFLFVSCTYYVDNTMHVINMKICNTTSHVIDVNINPNQEQHNAEYADSIKNLICNPNTETELEYKFRPGEYYVVSIDGATQDAAIFTVKYSFVDKDTGYILEDSMYIFINNIKRYEIDIIRSPLKAKYSNYEMEKLLQKITSQEDKAELLSCFRKNGDYYELSYYSGDYSKNLYEVVTPIFNKYGIQIIDYIFCFTHNLVN